MKILQFSQYEDYTVLTWRLYSSYNMKIIQFSQHEVCGNNIWIGEFFKINILDFLSALI